MNAEQKISILLVDDDSTLSRLMVMALEFAGYRVRAAANGKEAQVLFSDEAPDILISDLHMPVMDGIRLVEWVRNEINNPLPILVLTAMGEQEVGQRVLKAGATRLATKPIPLADLLSEVKALAAM